MQRLSGFEKATFMTTGMVSAVAMMAGAANAQDFDGLYMGASISSLSGDNPWDPSWSNDYQMENDATPGMFIGFNKSIGSLVAGGELAIQGWTPGDKNDDSSYEEYGITSAIDLKGRLGTAMTVAAKPVLFYGFAGISSVNMANYYGAGYNAPGANYGVGAEVKVSENFGIGLEFLGRTMHAYDGEGYEDGSNKHQQITLRAALHF